MSDRDHLPAEQKLDPKAASLVNETLWCYIHSRMPNVICIESNNDADESMFDITIEEAMQLRDWLIKVLP